MSGRGGRIDQDSTHGGQPGDFYPGSDSYSDRSRDRYSGSQYPPPNQAPKVGSSEGGYSRGSTGSATGSTPYGNIDSQGYTTYSGYPGGYGNDNHAYGGGYPGGTIDGSGRGGGKAGGGGPPMYDSSKQPPVAPRSMDRTPSDPGSLYASGAARFGDGRSSSARPSRFDGEGGKAGAPPQQASYTGYPPGYGGGYGAPPPNQGGGGGQRSGRSRFDTGPGTAANPSAPPPVGGAGGQYGQSPASQTTAPSHPGAPAQVRNSITVMHLYYNADLSF